MFREVFRVARAKHCERCLGVRHATSWPKPVSSRSIDIPYVPNIFYYFPTFGINHVGHCLAHILIHLPRMEHCVLAAWLKMGPSAWPWRVPWLSRRPARCRAMRTRSARDSWPMTWRHWWSGLICARARSQSTLIRSLPWRQWKTLQVKSGRSPVILNVESYGSLNLMRR